MAVERGLQFFHGTTHDIPEGGSIVPANKSGKSQWGSHGYAGQKSNEHAFATENERTAWDFASNSGTMARAKAHLGSGDGVEPGRARVHEVAPNPAMRMGVFHSDHPKFRHDAGDLREWVAPAFKSKGTIDIKPGQQGTFPSINWNQFKGDQSEYLADANHPTDGDIEIGHRQNLPLVGMARDRLMRNTPARDEQQRQPETLFDMPGASNYNGPRVGVEELQSLLPKPSRPTRPLM